MTVFDTLALIGGLCLFLFGMNIMGSSLERCAGGKLQNLLEKLTTNKFTGLLTGIGVTSIIQSSSATTVMVVGFVNSGLMTLKQSINVIMGANIGTTITAWILSLGGIQGDHILLQLLKPTSFTPVLALVGTMLFMFSKCEKKKDIGMIFLGFTVLMYGMDTMTASVSGLADIPEFQNLFLMFKNPILGVLAGALLTAIIQSSSASVGILQALAITGAVSYGAAIPIIMGQNIGTCITAILSSFGTNKNAKRAAVVHLSFNIVGTIVWISVFSIVNMVVAPAIFNESATISGIAIVHSLFNIGCTLLLLPASSLLEKIAYIVVPKTEDKVVNTELDERLLTTPSFAIDRCNDLIVDMGKLSIESFEIGVQCLMNYDEKSYRKIKETEEKIDYYEDYISSYIVKVSMLKISELDSTKAALLLKVIGDFERISDYVISIMKSSKELTEKHLKLSKEACFELENMGEAMKEILECTFVAFETIDIDRALKIEPYEKVIKKLKESMRNQHINRLRNGTCSIESTFIWSDCITNMERICDHCTNIARCIIDLEENSYKLHDFDQKDFLEFSTIMESFEKKYLLVNEQKENDG